MGSEQYLLLVSRFIELNPVRTAMVEHPAEYPWSSYHINALDKDFELIAPHRLYRQSGNTKAERRAAYQALFRHHIPEVSFKEIQASTNKAWVLGSERFQRQIEAQTGRRAAPMQRGGGRKSRIHSNSIENQQL